ncbi:MAG: iron-containing alcohol dehydrogenase [Clostridia bacterium]|nr:iron-containing alcohol dehydrogenase [Clostridia bacterium]
MYYDPKLFEYLVPIMEGAGYISLVGERIKKLGATKVIIVHDKNLKEIGIVDKVTNSLDAAGIKWVSFDKVLPNPHDQLCEEGSALAHKENIDGIIAIGGGSAIDTAKGIDLLTNNPPPLSQYFGQITGRAGDIQPKPGLPFIAIPTTSGTGSEMTGMGTITMDGGKGEKRAIWPKLSHDKRLALIDPEILTGMPYGLTVSTGMDAMAHAMEAMTNLIQGPMGDTFAMEAIRTIVKWLPVAAKEPTNIKARAKMAHAAALAGVAFTNCGLHIGHSAAEIIGAVFHQVPHGNCCAAVLPATVEFAAKDKPEKIRMMAEAMGIDIPDSASDEEAGHIVGDAIRALNTSLGVKRVADFGVTREELVTDEIAERIRTNPSSKTCPHPPTIEEIKALLEDSLR